MLLKIGFMGLSPQKGRAKGKVVPVLN